MRKYLLKNELPDKQEVYFSGDIVEILYLTEWQMDTMVSVMSKMANKPGQLIGFRYKLECSLALWNVNQEIYYKLLGFTFDHIGAFKSNQFRLVYRPLKNWLKLLWLYISGRYYP